MESNKNREAISNYVPLYIKNKKLGRVHSKFKNGLNVQFDEFLVYLSIIGTPISAFGFNIDKEKLKKILDNIEIDHVVINKDRKLYFYGINEIIIVEYDNVEYVDLRIPKISCQVSEIPYTKLFYQLEKIDFAQNIGIELDDKTSYYIDLLLSSDKSNTKLNLDIINFFTGRGKGLTPSGDDILLGFSLTLAIFNKFDNWMNAIELGINNTSTTLISLSYLKALNKRYVSDYFLELAKLLDQDDEYTIDKIIKKIQSFGHTSGNDTLFGFYIGLKFLTILTNLE